MIKLLLSCILKEVILAFCMCVKSTNLSKQIKGIASCLLREK